MPKVILIAGPTASGKSALALKLAREFDAEIVNADSMQVYQELRVITARPSAADEDIVRHHLYGHISVAQNYSVGNWVIEAGAAIDELLGRKKGVIVVGGTGLYFKALTEGLAEVPPIDSIIRRQVRDLVGQEGAEYAHSLLHKEDPAMAKALNAHDGQRIARALEVVRSTGKSLAEWQALNTVGVLERTETPFEEHRFVLMPPREWLYERCDRRFDLMIKEGAIDEVKALNRLPEGSLAAKALGVPDLLAYIRGEVDLDTAARRAKTASRQYAKRQMTWFRNQNTSWQTTSEKDSERIFRETCNIIINN